MTRGLLTCCGLEEAEVGRRSRALASLYQPAIMCSVRGDECLDEDGDKANVANTWEHFVYAREGDFEIVGGGHGVLGLQGGIAGVGTAGQRHGKQGTERAHRKHRKKKASEGGRTAGEADEVIKDEWHCRGGKSQSRFRAKISNGRWQSRPSPVNLPDPATRASHPTPRACAE